MSYYDQEAEQYVIGACILNQADRLEAIKKLHYDDFSSSEHSQLFKVIKSLVEASRPIDRRTVIGSLPNDVAVLSALEQAILYSNGVDADYYINKVKDLGTKRRLVHVYNQLGRDLESATNASDIIGNAQDKLTSLTCSDIQKEKTLAEALSSFKDGLSYRDWLREQSRKYRAGEVTLDGFTSGYDHLDGAIGGFENGTYTIIGASTSSGKTTYIINLIMNILRECPNASIAFFTLEMTIPQLIHKLMGAYVNVRPGDLKKGNVTDEELERVYVMEDILMQNRIVFNNEKPATENSIRNNFRRQIHNHGANIMFVDYITKIKSHNKYSSRHLEIDSISGTLHDIALEFNIPVIALAQLSRNLSGRLDKRPLLSDLRESGSLEEHADNVLLLHRPKKYNEALAQDYTEVYIAKNRHDNNLGKLVYSFHQGVLIEERPIEEMAQASLYDQESTKVDYAPIRSYRD